MPHGFLIFIHHPGHYLRSGVNVRRRHINIRSHKIGYCSYVGPAKSLQFTFTELLWITYDSTLGPSKWKVCDGSFPCHPCCKCLYSRKCLLRVEPYSSLCRPSGVVVMHPETGEDLCLTIVHLYWKSDLQYRHWFAQQIKSLLV